MLKTVSLLWRVAVPFRMYPMGHLRCHTSCTILVILPILSLTDTNKAKRNIFCLIQSATVKTNQTHFCILKLVGLRWKRARWTVEKEIVFGIKTAILSHETSTNVCLTHQQNNKRFVAVFRIGVCWNKRNGTHNTLRRFYKRLHILLSKKRLRRF